MLLTILIVAVQTLQTVEY